VILNGRDIGAAHRATADVLLHLLAGAGTDFETWAVLETLASPGVAVPRSELVPAIARGAQASDSWIEKTIDDAEAAGLVLIESPHDGRPADVALRLTPEGTARHRELRSAVDNATDQLFAAIPHSELRAAQRVLAEVTIRADAWLRDHTPAAEAS
jgi:DNA-binding MarR family transcriptional regulator